MYADKFSYMHDRACAAEMDALVKVSTMQDRSFTFILKTPPASVLLQKAAGIQKGSGTPNSKKVGKVTQAQVRVSTAASLSKHLVLSAEVNSLDEAA